MTNRLSNIFNGLKDMFFGLITSAVEMKRSEISGDMRLRTRRGFCNKRPK